MRIAVDTSVLVAILDNHDKFNGLALTLADALSEQAVELFYLDCVIVETIGVFCRRAQEQRRIHHVNELLTKLEDYVAKPKISWVTRDLEQFYPDVVDIVRNTNGQLNFNDALIAITCRELEIEIVASFDQDFDLIPWLKRIARPEDLQSA
jgi:predicted nucleic acid-binding protein